MEFLTLFYLQVAESFGGMNSELLGTADENNSPKVALSVKARRLEARFFLFCNQGQASESLITAPLYKDVLDAHKALQTAQPLPSYLNT